MNVYVGNRLPSTYQEVEYIQSTGTQWINTGYNPNNNTNFECKVNMQPGTTFQFPRVFGVRNGQSGSSERDFSLQFDRDNIRLGLINYSNAVSTYQITSGTLAYNTDYVVKGSNTQMFINGVSQGTVSATTYSISYPIWLFNDNQAGTDFDRKAKMKLYRFKMYNGITLVRDFIPCYRKSDNVIGLYDLVNNQFYTNSGTGTFSKGSDVITNAELKNAYIGDVWTPNANTLGYYPLTATTTVNDQSGNGNNMTNNNSVTFGTNAGVSCGSFANSASKYLSLGKALFTGNSSFTVSIWAYRTSTTADTLMLWGGGTNSSTNGIVLYTRNGDIQYGWWGTDVSTSTTLPLNAWHNLVFTYDGSTMRVYMDGTLISTTAQTLNLSNTRTLIGASLNLSGANKWNGYLSEVIFENKVRTAKEVQDYYNNTKSNYGLS